MNLLAPLALVGWIPVVVVLFMLLPARRAVITAFVTGWLFLPQAGIDLPGLPDYTKTFATCVGTLLATFIFDPNRLLHFKPRWIDLPMIVWCWSPLATSIANGLGVYDGLSESLTKIIAWGLPYFIGRQYFNDLESIRELLIGLIMGALVYVPLCWFEVRMSPQLHRILYGFTPSGVFDMARYGGFRPVVFLANGLLVATWLSFACIATYWLKVTRSAQRILNIPLGLALTALIVTLILCKSLGPLIMLLVGGGLLYTMRRWRTTLVIAVLLLIPPFYVVGRTTGGWSGNEVLNLAGAMDEDRKQSMEFRFMNEERLISRALEQPLLGWGGAGRSHVFDEQGKDISITDGLWIIALGNGGMISLAALLAIFLVPVGTILTRWHGRPLLRHESAGLQVAIVLTCLAAINNLPNADTNPVNTLMIGGISTLALAGRRELAALRQQDWTQQGYIYSPTYGDQQRITSNAAPDSGPACA